MRKRWFGDSRDYVKWSCIRRVAGNNLVVVYGVMLGNDGFKGKNLDLDVKAFFDKLKDFQALKELFPCGFFVEDAPYTKQNADAYFTNLVSRIASFPPDRSVLVFLDPDTGIEPEGQTTDKHLRISDIRRVCAALRPADKLIIYQHALHTKDWIARIETRLQDLCTGLSMTLVDTFHEPGVAKDVCFFILTRIGP